MLSWLKSKGCKNGKIATMPDVPGILLFKSGHVGVYVGNGYAVEAQGFAYRWRTSYREIESIFDTLWIASWGANEGTYTGWEIKSAALTDKIHLHQYTSNGYSKVAGAPGIDHRIDLNRLTGAVPLSWFTGRKYAENAVQPTYASYVVQSGDSLWKIAKNLLGDGRRWTEIAALNEIENTIIHTGEVLKIPE